jgi:hypothetical protein
MKGPLPYYYQYLQRVHQTTLSHVMTVYKGGSIIVMMEMDKYLYDTGNGNEYDRHVDMASPFQPPKSEINALNVVYIKMG